MNCGLKHMLSFRRLAARHAWQSSFTCGFFRNDCCKALICCSRLEHCAARYSNQPDKGIVDTLMSPSPRNVVSLLEVSDALDMSTPASCHREYTITRTSLCTPRSRKTAKRSPSHTAIIADENTSLLPIMRPASIESDLLFRSDVAAVVINHMTRRVVRRIPDRNLGIRNLPQLKSLGPAI
jgi:hypothetical protein